MRKLLIFLSFYAQIAFCKNGWVVESESGKLQVEVVSDTIQIPYSMAFLPDSKLLISDRAKGVIYLLDTKNNTQTLIKNTPKTAGAGFGGMMDIALHPNYKQNGWIYFNYTIYEQGLYKMVLDRAKLAGTAMTGCQRLFKTNNGYKDEEHVGSSIAFKDGYVYFWTGVYI